LSRDGSAADNRLPCFGTIGQNLLPLHDQLVQYEIQRLDRILAVFATIMEQNDSVGLQFFGEISQDVLGVDPCPVAGV